jgi:hypothetical protein
VVHPTEWFADLAHAAFSGVRKTVNARIQNDGDYRAWTGDLATAASEGASSKEKETGEENLDVHSCLRRTFCETIDHHPAFCLPNVLPIGCAVAAESASRFYTDVPAAGLTTATALDGPYSRKF